jgi:hypothetical protein
VAWAEWITKPPDHSLGKNSTTAGLARVRLFCFSRGIPKNLSDLDPRWLSTHVQSPDPARGCIYLDRNVTAAIDILIAADRRLPRPSENDYCAKNDEIDEILHCRFLGYPRYPVEKSSDALKR